LEKETILVVEDEELVALSIKDYLENAGYNVPETVSTGEGAVKTALSLRPDIIIMDIRLKGNIDGTDAAEQIRESANIPVIYLTSYSDQQIV
jgi:CheY-like chemotaxis protein